MRILISGLALLVLPSLTGREAEAQVIDSTLVGRFQLAESYLRAGQYDRAISLLEDLYNREPTTFVFFNRLVSAYELVKQYDEAIRLVDEQIQRETLPVMRWAERGRLLHLSGREQEAERSFQTAITLAPDSPASYRSIYNVLVQLRLFEEAVATLESGRASIGDPNLFRAELGYLYGLTGQHAEAMKEFVALLASDERQIGVVRSRLTRTGLSAVVLDESIPIVERAVRDNPLNRTYRELLAWLYEESNLYDRALEVNRAIDRLESEEGRVLFSFAARASSAGAFEAAQRAYRIILERYPHSIIAPEAARGVGQMELKWARSLGERAFVGGERIPTPHYDAAIQAFERFTEMNPGHGLFPYVLLDMAQIKSEVFFELRKSKELFEQIVARYPGHPAAHEARYALGTLAISQGRLDDANLVFRRLEDELRIGEQAERARLEIALVHFYRGEFEAALTILEAMEENTSMDVANDAIELKVLLFENKGPDSLATPLREYATARLLVRQRRLAEADSVLGSIRERFGSHALSDDADYLRAVILHERGEYAAAAAAFGEIPLVYQNSFLADRSIFEAARIHEEDLGQPERALELYSRILTDYPASLLLIDVRHRIRVLRGDGVL